MIEIRHYLDRAGRDVFDGWFTTLSDRRAQAKVATRINRLASGNFGDCRSLRHGLHELRIDWGPGYRIYFALIDRTAVLLLCGGDKRSQTVDIDRALGYLQDYKERTSGNEAKNKRLPR